MEVTRTFGFITINDDRIVKKEATRELLANWDEIVIPCVDGSNLDNLTEGKKQFRNDHAWFGKPGEYGVWLSQINAWKTIIDYGRPVLVLEDDAILTPHFEETFDHYMSQVPDDFGLFTVFVPENQYGDYNYEYTCDENGHFIGAAQGHPSGAPSIVLPGKDICRAYQGYGCVANYISPLGAAALLDYALDRGIDTPVDCFIFEAYRAKKLDAYSFRPGFPRLADVDWSAPSTIQYQERIVI